jgi:hypothetical protein
VLGDVYIAEEMEQARVIDAEPAAPRPTLAERAATRAAEIVLPAAEPIPAEVSAKYTNAEEVAEGARPILRLPPADDAPPWTRERLHGAAITARIPSTLVIESFNAVAGSRTRQELTESDWAAIALRLGLGA